MGFFQDIHALVADSPFTVSVFPDNGNLTVTVIPHPRAAINRPCIVPLKLTGSPAELDEQLIPILSNYQLRHTSLTQQAAAVSNHIDHKHEALKNKKTKQPGDRGGTPHPPGPGRDPAAAATEDCATVPHAECALSTVPTSSEGASDGPSNRIADGTGSSHGTAEWVKKNLAQQDLFDMTGIES